MWLKKILTRKKRKNSCRAFTLIEVLIAASILGVIGLTILTTFSSGFTVYERVQAYGGVQADVLLALEEMEGRLRNVFPFSTIEFEGDVQRISFPTIIETVEEIDGESVVVSSVGKAAYYLSSTDGETKSLAREQQNYAQAMVEGEAQEGENSSLVAIKDLQFSYYAFGDEEGKHVWQESWPIEEEGFPAGVKIEVTFQDGKRDIQLVRTVMISSVRVIDEREEAEGEDDGEEEGQDDV